MSEELKQTAMRYLKQTYNEDTVSMEVIDDTVKDGAGVLHVNCTVSVGGARSNWSKWFTFKGGEVVDLRAKIR